MKTNERLTFKIEDVYGNEQDCEALFTFESCTNGKHYIIYTNHEKDEDGDTKVFAGVYVPNLERQTIKPIETDHEWMIIETVLEHIMSNVERADSPNFEEELNELLDELELDFPTDDDLSREYIYSNVENRH